MKTRRYMYLPLVWTAAVTAALGQSEAPSRITVGGVEIRGVPTDWSHRHVIFSNPGAEAESVRAGTHDRWLKIVNDPRYTIQQLQRRQPGQGPSGVETAGLLALPAEEMGASASVNTPDKKQNKHRDWSMDLGQGGVYQNTYPAKWPFSTTTANCASDFVAFTTGTTAGSSQATITAYNNLYSGCGGTVPGVYWQFNTGTGYYSNLSPVLSADGSQIAFVQSSQTSSLVILKWAANSSLFSLPNTPPAYFRNCTAPCMTVIPFASSGNDRISSPFYDYANDAIYAGDIGHMLHKFTGIFKGTPAEAGSPWPATVGSGSGELSSPVLDSVSGRITVGSLGGGIFSVNSATDALAVTSGKLDFMYGIFDAPLVDSSAATIYAFAGNDAKSNCSDGYGNTGCSGVYQFPVTFTSGTGTEMQIGLGYYPLFSGSFDNIYYNSNASSPTGNLYVCGQTDYHYQQTLNQISIAANAMAAQTVSPYSVGAGNYCSPVTEFYNAAAATDYVFLGSDGAFQGCALNTGCLFGFNITNGAVPDSAEFGAATGGASGIVVDNSVSSGTLAGASQLYFTTEASGNCATSGGTGLCGVQDSQTSLYVDWSQFHFAPDRDGLNVYENLLSPSTVGGLAVSWSHTTGSSVSSSPAVVSGVVYVGSDDNKVYALNALTGAPVWSYTTGNYVQSSPSVANGIVYAGCLDHKVYALNASTGALVWSYTTGSDVNSSPAVVNGVVYVGSGDDKVYALNASTGALVWSFATAGAVEPAPAVANGVVYVGSSDYNVYALNASTGALLWSYRTFNGVLASAAVANGVVYVGSSDDKVYALNASTGALLWSYTTGGSVQSTPAVANGVVYVGSDSKVYALNASTGALLWTYTTRSGVYSSPAVANGVVYVGSYDNKVFPERLHRRAVVELRHRKRCVFLARRGRWGGLRRLVGLQGLRFRASITVAHGDR